MFQVTDKVRQSPDSRVHVQESHACAQDTFSASIRANPAEELSGALPGLNGRLGENSKGGLASSCQEKLEAEGRAGTGSQVVWVLSSSC